MKRSRLLGALAFALLVSFAATWLLSRRMTAPPVPPQALSVHYAAPSRALEADETLTAGNTQLVDWPANLPLEGAFAGLADVIGREALFPLAKGQPILSRHLAAADAGTGLAGKIPNGMRAVALRSDEIVGVAGFLVPGSHLDVLVTYSPDHAADPVTATVLENVLVLAAGHQIEPDPNGKSVDAAVVTLLLTPEQAERAVLAAAQGAIHFVLRNGGDKTRSTGSPMLLSRLAISPAATPLPVSRPTRRSVASPVAAREIETILAGAESRSPAIPNGGGGQ